MGASIFPTSSIEVYHKTKSISDERPMSQIPYVLMTQSNQAISSEGRSQSPYNDNYKEDFFDYNFEATSLPEFSSFAIKIVMKGTNPAYPPRVKDMRTIALAI